MWHIVGWKMYREKYGMKRKDVKRESETQREKYRETESKRNIE